MHRLILGRGNIDLTNRIQYIRRRSSLNELSEQLDFSFAESDVNLIPIEINPGDLIVLLNLKELFRGIAVTENKQGRSFKEFNCFDFSYYLNKNKEIYQFNTTVSNAVRTICNDFKIPIGNIVNIPTKVKKIYYDELSSTLQDMIGIAEKERGIKYIFEMREGKFYLEEKKNHIIKLTTNIFGTTKNITEFISNPTRTRSIENMKNSIKVVQSSEDKVKVLATAKNQSLINRYGLLQEIQSIDEKEVSKAKSIAENVLKDLGRITEEASFEIPGHDDCRAGRILEIREEVTGLKGLYNIKDCTHEVRNSIHKMQLGLELI